MYRHLKSLRVIVATLVLLVLTLAFIPFIAKGSAIATFLTSIQFLPSLMRLLQGFSIAFILLVLLTLLIGRVYCSWICPLGIYQDVVIRISQRFKIRKSRRFKYASPKFIRYPLLFILIVAYIFGLTLPLAYLDPYSLWGRAVTTTFGTLTGGGATMVALSLALLPLLVVTYFSLFHGRLYCNTICPVGAILSLLSRYSLFKPSINKEACTRCYICAASCKAQAIDLKNKEIDNSRCIGCLNCMITCPKGGVRYAFSPPKWFKKGEDREEKEVTKEERDISLDRRSALATIALLGGAIGTKIYLPSKSEDDRKKKQTVAILPPGASTVSHLKEHCTVCHACIAVCPSNIIKPAINHYGIDGLLLPYVSYEDGYCQYDCNLCSTICPNEAISTIDLKSKQILKIGAVRFYKERCIIESEGRKCTVCKDVCPLDAISLVKRKGEGNALPRVDGRLCIGCGACQYSCPASPEKALIILAMPSQRSLKMKEG